MISSSILENPESLLMKQTIIQFKEHFPRKFRKHRQLSTVQMPNPQKYHFQVPYKQTHSALKPKLPSKKLFDEPKFFLSLERKKNKILDGLRNVSQFSHNSQPLKTLEKKVKKDRATTSQKKSCSFMEDQDLFSEANKFEWHPNKKTPFLNFNMQYLIRKRKSMTPNLERQNDRLCQTIHSTRTTLSPFNNV